jgi:hypothetical protein
MYELGVDVDFGAPVESVVMPRRACQTLLTLTDNDRERIVLRAKGQHKFSLLFAAGGSNVRSL